MGLPKYVSQHQLEFVDALMPIKVFGFAAALLEGLPIIGLMFTISNRIGAAMWAHGLPSSSIVWNLSPTHYCRWFVLSRPRETTTLHCSSTPS